MFETVGELLQKKVIGQWDDLDLRLYSETMEWGADLRFGSKKTVDTKWHVQISSRQLKQCYSRLSGQSVGEELKG